MPRFTNTITRSAISAVFALTFSNVGCGGSSGATSEGGSSSAARGAGGKAIRTGGGQAVNLEAHNRWKEGVAAFQAAEKQGWTPQRCSNVSEQFEDAADAQNKFAEAYYMAGVVHQRCGDADKARDFFQKALRQNSKFCKARVAIGLETLKSSESSANREFVQAIQDDNGCTEGYVNLAILQRKKGDTKEALNNLRRALAIDAQYLPAFNEMALLYLQDAKDNVKMLDLAEVVCSQAQKIDVNFAPVYNTWGLIDLRRKEIIGAAAKFQKAFQLDPKMFEAYMNFAQITIGFRGYEDARAAFTKALELRPKSFDAVVGLGVAYRGLGQNDKAEEYYEKAKAMNANRPEPYYNLGLLYQDFKDGTLEQMKKAKGYYEQYLTRAGTEDRYASAAEDIKRRCKTVRGQRKRDKCIAGRFQNIEDYHQALKEIEEMEKLEKEGKRQAAELEKEAARQAAELEKEAARQAADEKKKAAETPAAEPATPGANPGAGNKDKPAKPEGKKK